MAACLGNHETKPWVMPEIPDGQPTKYGWIVRHPQFFVLSPHTDIGAFTYIQAECGVVIEENVQIGSHVSIYSKSTINKTAGKVILKRGCCIGSHAVIMPGVTIGEGAKVGAFSYITHDVMPFTVIHPSKIFTIKEG